jgi:hypothetical protein
MPELPRETRMRLMSVGLTEQETEVLMTVDAGREVRFDGEPARGAVQYFDRLAQGRSTKCGRELVCTIGFEHRVRHCVLRLSQDDTRAPGSTRCSQRHV